MGKAAAKGSVGAPKTKPGHNGRYPEEAKKGSYKPNDPARAKTYKV